MTQTNPQSLLRSPLGRWGGLVILLAVLLTTVGVQITREQKAHADNVCSVQPNAKVSICLYSDSSIDPNPPYAFIGYETAGGLQYGGCESVKNTSGPVIAFPVGYAIVVQGSPDSQCHYAVQSQTISFIIPSGVGECNVTFYASGDGTAPYYFCH